MTPQPRPQAQLSTRMRTHTCGELNADRVGEDVALTGWVHNRRDLGGVLFLDLRDHYGITQILVRSELDLDLAHVPKETVLRIEGSVLARSPETVNPAIETGEIEVEARQAEVLGPAEPLPFTVFPEEDAPEESRLQYRFLDLRRSRMHENVVLRSTIIASLRERMQRHGFLELQTPTLTASSPEGAARLPRSLPGASGQVLRAAAGAAAVQAAADGRRLRPLLPDRPLLPRRGRPRGPLAGRVLPTRYRDELRRAGGRLRGGRGRAARAVHRSAAGVGDDAAAVSAHPLRGGDGALRLRQAGPAHPAGDARRRRRLRRLGGARAQRRPRLRHAHTQTRALPGRYGPLRRVRTRVWAPVAWPGSSSSPATPSAGRWLATWRPRSSRRRSPRSAPRRATPC